MTFKRAASTMLQLFTTLLVCMKNIVWIVAVGFFCSCFAIEPSPKESYVCQFRQVLDLVSKSHISKPTHQELVDKALAGMLSSLDAYSAYMVGEEANEFLQHSSGKFAGIGIEALPSEDNLTLLVVSVISGSPAERSGLKPGDRIVAVDGKLVKEIGYAKSMQSIRGTLNTKVKLAVQSTSSSAPVEHVIVRESISQNPVKASFEDGIAYVRVLEFVPTTTTEVKKAIKGMVQERKPLRGIILDLRNNPGGALDQAVSLTEYFIDSGVVVGIKGRDGTTEEIVALKSAPKAPKVPMVVLVNWASASASEIVAGALQAHKRAVIVGSKSYGKGSVQHLIKIEPTRPVLIKLTTALFCTPDGKFIDKEGIMPDVAVEDSIRSLSAAEKRQLIIQSNKPNPLHDQQYKKACEVINVISNFQLR